MKINDFINNYLNRKEKGIKKEEILIKEVNIKDSHTLVVVFNTIDKTYYYFNKALEKELIEDKVPDTFKGYTLAIE